MKRLSTFWRSVFFTILSSLVSLGMLAQEVGEDVIEDIDLDVITSEIDKGPYYTQLWFWIVLGLIFLILLIALLLGSGGKKKVEEEKEDKQQVSS